MEQDLRGKDFAVTVTVANTCIGCMNAPNLIKMGGTVTMACWSDAKGKAVLQKLRQEVLDKPGKAGGLPMFVFA